MAHLLLGEGHVPGLPSPRPILHPHRKQTHISARDCGPDPAGQTGRGRLTWSWPGVPRGRLPRRVAEHLAGPVLGQTDKQREREQKTETVQRGGRVGGRRPENLYASGHLQARSACSPTGDPLPSTSPPRGGTPGPGHRARGGLVWDRSPSLALGARLPAAAPAGTTDGGGLCSRSFQDVLLPLPLLGLRWAADYLPSQRRPVDVSEQPRRTRHHPRPRNQR